MHIPDGATLMGTAAIITSLSNLILTLRADPIRQLRCNGHVNGD